MHLVIAGMNFRFDKSCCLLILRRVEKITMWELWSRTSRKSCGGPFPQRSPV